MARPLDALPKAHLHLHFTGAMRHSTLVELAAARGVHLPDALVTEWPPRLSGTDERGWFRFQRLYDIARSVVRTEADVHRLILEAATDERDEGSGWLEIQVDPSGYAARFGGLTPTVELVLGAAAEAAEATGVGVGVIIAANRTRHPLDARTLARIGHGVAAAGDADLLERVAAARITLEVCPSSNVALGVAATPADVPLRLLLDAGIEVALGADDPLLFGRRLTAQYQLAREAHGLSDGELAELARMSVRGSVAPAAVRARLLAGIDGWLASPEAATPAQAPALPAR
jgi:adenosine deaminase